MEVTIQIHRACFQISMPLSNDIIQKNAQDVSADEVQIVDSH